MGKRYIFSFIKFWEPKFIKKSKTNYSMSSVFCTRQVLEIQHSFTEQAFIELILWVSRYPTQCWRQRNYKDITVWWEWQAYTDAISIKSEMWGSMKSWCRARHFIRRCRRRESNSCSEEVMTTLQPQGWKKLDFPNNLQ